MERAHIKALRNLLMDAEYTAISLIISSYLENVKFIKAVMRLHLQSSLNY